MKNVMNLFLLINLNLLMNKKNDIFVLKIINYINNYNIYIITDGVHNEIRTKNN